jgi:hypothetical protein
MTPRVRAGTTESQLIDEALTALLACLRSAEIDEAYEAAYRSSPIDEPDEWGISRRFTAQRQRRDRCAEAGRTVVV